MDVPSLLVTPITIVRHVLGSVLDRHRKPARVLRRTLSPPTSSPPVTRQRSITTTVPLGSAVQGVPPRRAGVCDPYRVPCTESLNTTAGIGPLCSLAFNLRYLWSVRRGYHAPNTFLSLVMNEIVHLAFQHEGLRRTSTPFRETDPVSPKPCAL